MDHRFLVYVIVISECALRERNPRRVKVKTICCICKYTSSLPRARALSHMRTYTHVCKKVGHTQISHVHVYIYIHVYMYMYTYTLTHIRTHAIICHTSNKYKRSECVSQSHQIWRLCGRTFACVFCDVLREATRSPARDAGELPHVGSSERRSAAREGRHLTWWPWLCPTRD